MPMVPPSWTRAISKYDYDDVVRDRADKKTWNYDDLYGEMGSTDEWQLAGFIYSGLGLPHERGYSQPILSQSMQELGSWLFEMIEISLGTDLDMRLVEQNRHIDSLIGKITEAHGESFGQALSKYAARPLNYAFNSTYMAMWDSAAWFASHTLANASTVNNKITTTTIGWDLIWDMVDWLRISQYSQKGLKKSGKAERIVFYPSKRRIFQKALESDGEPDTEFTNNKNTLKQWNLKFTECIELSDTGAVYMFGERAMKNMVFKRRKPVTRVTTDEERNRTRSILSHMQIIFGVMDWDDACAMSS